MVSVTANGAEQSEDDSQAQVFAVGGTTVIAEAVESHVRCNAFAEDSTGFELWRPATAAACRQLLAKKPLDVRGARVLELGCGLGVLGVFCAKLGASSVCLTDREPSVLQLAERTAKANGVAARCSYAVVDFGAGPLPFHGQAFDLVVASDVLFLDRLAPRLLAALRSLSCDGRPPPLALIGHEVRRAVYKGPDGEPQLEEKDSALEVFLSAARAQGAQVSVEWGSEPASAAVALRWSSDEPLAKRSRTS